MQRASGSEFHSQRTLIAPDNVTDINEDMLNPVASVASSYSMFVFALEGLSAEGKGQEELNCSARRSS